MAKRRLALDAPMGLYALYAATRVARAPRLRLATTDDVRLRAYRPQALHNGFHPDGGHLVVNIGRRWIVVVAAGRSRAVKLGRTDVTRTSLLNALLSRFSLLYLFPAMVTYSYIFLGLYLSLSLGLLMSGLSLLVYELSDSMVVVWLYTYRSTLFYFTYSAVPYFQL
ncbi:hypothetical protein B0H13DRAFT_1994461 [Mycena leptocephala]|nr:hypothetical protein B0H13DRAFT_1994461 [Mycena leptocephala]